ncbi:methyl-accepting chemotaxis protein [Treponema phagedenis]|uniref:methyl-accepting chemotaxis protein n=1 Tax=Treponema phagedenis TaxID=162 RepID=UPI0011E79EBD|nr:methyl-accepting chemotaxis protein [Treponema phagedenis]QEJ94850.1 methyl-accepting chemotaxis protein [Treponema phagedenis]
MLENLADPNREQLNLNYEKTLDTTNFYFDIKVLNNGKVIGIAGVGISLTNAVEGLKKANPSPHSSLYLIDANDKIISSSNRDDVEKKLSDIVLGAHRSTVEGFNHIESYTDTDGHKMILSMQKLDRLPYRIVLISRLDDFVPTAWELLKTPVILIAVFFIIILISGNFLIGALFKKFNIIYSLLEDLSNGNFTKRIQSDNDEVGIMANFFNKTLDAVRDSFKSVKGETIELQSIGDSLLKTLKKPVSR